MGQNESRASSKFKLNQNNGCSNINTEGSKTNSSEMASASVSSFKQDGVNLDHGKPPNPLPTNNHVKCPDKTRVEFCGRGESGSFLSNKKPDFQNQPQDLNLENQSNPFIANRLESQYEISSKKPVKLALKPPTTKPQKHNYEQQPPFFPTRQHQGQKDDKQPVIFSTTQPKEQENDKLFIQYSTTHSQEQKDNKQPVLFPTGHTQGQKEDEKPALFSIIQTKEQKDEKLHILLSATQSQGQNESKKPALIPTTQPKEQKDDKQSVIFSTTHSQVQKDDKKPVLFSSTQPKEQKYDKQPVFFSITQPQEQEYNKLPILLTTTKSKGQKHGNQNVAFLTGQPLMKNFSSLPQNLKEINQPVCNVNQQVNSESITIKETDNKPLKKIITSGNPFLKSNSNGKCAKDIFEVNVNDQCLAIPPFRSDSSDAMIQIKDAKHITEIDSLVSQNHDPTKDLNIPLYKSLGSLPNEAVNNQSSSLRVARLKESTKDETVEKTLKHFEKIAEGLACSADKSQTKEESVKTEFTDSPNKGRHNQWMLHNCIVKMRNVRDDDDKELVLSLQKQIVSHLQEMEHFTSVLKTCPVINSNIYYLCENIKENLSLLKTNYETKNTHKHIESISTPKVELYKNFEIQKPSSFSQDNKIKYTPHADHYNSNLFFASNDRDGNYASVSSKESIKDSGENKTITTPLMDLLDQLPEYLTEEKQNISLRNNELFCRICEKSICFVLFNLKEHLSGKNHRALVAASKKSCDSTKEFTHISYQSDSCLPNKPTSTAPSAELISNVCQAIEPAVNISFPQNYGRMLDLISRSVEEGLNFGVDVFICLLCDFFENEKSKALSHVKINHEDQQNLGWHFCKTCLIHMYGTSTHFKEHRLTVQHINIAKFKNECPQEEVSEEKCPPDTASMIDEFDRGSVCSSKSDTSNRSRTRMTAHEILLAIAKDKKVKGMKVPVGLYCQVCRKYDIDNVVFSDHLDSKQHIQSCSKQNFRRKVLGFKVCETCGVCLFGDDDIWVEHQNLQVHKELLASASEINNQNGLTNRFDLPKANSSVSCGTESNSPLPSSPEDLETNISEHLLSLNESGPHYDFMKTVLKKNLEKKPTNIVYGLYCHLCQVYFLDREQWESHLRSSSHKTITNSPKYVGRVAQHNCVECNIHLFCDEQFFNLHLQSLAHKAISRIEGRRQQVEESGTEEDYSEDEYDSSENEEESEESLSKQEDPQRKSNEANSREGKINKLTCVPNGVYFRGLPQGLENKDVAEYFKRFGPIKSCKIVKRLGSGSCIYKNKIDATRVLTKKTVYFNRTPVMVRPLMGKPPEPKCKLDPEVELVLGSRRSVAAIVSDILYEINQNFIISQQKGLEIRQDLSATMPGSRVLFFGSQVTGLATEKSDFDIYIDYDGKSFYTDLSDDKQRAIIQHLQSQLDQRGSKFVVRETILEARVPIIRVVHEKTKTLCDISCRSGLSVENSQLVRLYMELDPRVRWLVVAVKFWMQANGLLDRNAFTSYATVWLVLFFLMRTTNPVVCPVVTLQKNCKPHTVARWDCRFHRDMKDVNRYFRVFNQQSELELLSSFFLTYATFPYKATVMCPLNGNVFPRSQFESLKLPREFSPYVDKIQCTQGAEKLKIQTPICLQDPFDLSHNVTKGVNRMDLEKFKTLCYQSHKMCQNHD